LLAFLREEAKTSEDQALIFTAEPGGGAFDKKDVIHMERKNSRA
jgi:hypothetical protein